MLLLSRWDRWYRHFLGLFHSPTHGNGKRPKEIKKIGLSHTAGGNQTHSVDLWISPYFTNPRTGVGSQVTQLTNEETESQTGEAIFPWPHKKAEFRRVAGSSFNQPYFRLKGL